MNIRELYFRKMILNVGHMINENYQIIDRRSNHVVCADSAGHTETYLIEEAYRIQQDSISSKTLKSIIGDNVVTMFSVDKFPKPIREAIEPFMDSADRYNMLSILKGIQAILNEEATAGLFDDVSKRLNKLDSTIVLSEHFNRPLIAQSTVKSTFIQTLLNKDAEPKPYAPKTLHAILESFDEIEHKLKSLKPTDIDHLADQVKDLEDIAHHYDADEIVSHVEEHLSREGRIKRSIEFRKTESKRERSRAISLKRLSSPQKIISKARKAAVALIKEKIAHKSLDKLSIGEKDRLEDLIAKRKDLVDRLARKLAPKIKEIEKNRVYHHGIKEEFVRKHVSILCESPAIVDSVFRPVFDQTVLRTIYGIDHMSVDIGDGMRKYSDSTHTMVYSKPENAKFSNASIFRIDGDIAHHEAASKLHNGEPVGIYKNIQHMVDSGYSVHSDASQSPGGRNLWNNIHNHVKFNQAGILKNGVKTPVNNFENEHDSDDTTTFYIHK